MGKKQEFGPAGIFSTDDPIADQRQIEAEQDNTCSECGGDQRECFCGQEEIDDEDGIYEGSNDDEEHYYQKKADEQAEIEDELRRKEEAEAHVTAANIDDKDEPIDDGHEEALKINKKMDEAKLREVREGLEK